MSDSLWTYGLLPARFLCLWDFPGKSAGVGYHVLLQGISLTQGSDHISYIGGRFFATEPPGKLWCWFAWVLCCFSCVQLLGTPWAIALQAPLHMEFSRQEYWSWLPFPPPEDLLNPGSEHASPVSPALQADSLLLSHWGNLSFIISYRPKY